MTRVLTLRDKQRLYNLTWLTDLHDNLELRE
jgi:hypothetical protein